MKVGIPFLSMEYGGGLGKVSKKPQKPDPSV